MEQQALHSALREAGVVESALIDVEARYQQHFAGQDVSALEVTGWASGLKPTAPHLFQAPPAPVPDQPPAWLSPTEKLTWHRTRHPAAPKAKPQRQDAPPEVLKQWEGKSPIERLTAYRQWQNEQKG
jgi:hypothetical protein